MSPEDTSMIIFKCCGLWRPEEWTSGWKFWLYNSYTVIVIFMVFSTPLLQFIGFFLTVNHDRTSGNSTQVMMTMIFASVKIVILLRHRERIIKLLAKLNTDDCQAKNSNEQTVQQHFHRLKRCRNRTYRSLIVVTIIAMTISFFSHIPRRILPYNMWLPFNTTSNFAYGVMFADQYVSLTFAAVLGTGFETFLFAIMIQISAQFGLIKCRIKNISAMAIECLNKSRLECFNVDQESDLKNRIANYVRHHLLIYQLSAEMNFIFGPAVLFNFMIGTVGICTTVYSMSQIKGFTAHLVSLIVYASLNLIELYMLCYMGSELTAESASISQTIYDVEWYNWSRSNKKSMLIMMARVSRPAIFTTGKIFQISVESYVKLVQFTYSAYTCLKQMSK